eukprot:ANDGO_06687.mRNA.1 Ran-binding protein 16
MDDSVFSQYEATCTQVLTAHSAELRKEAENRIAEFLSTTADVPKAFQILMRSQEPYALYITLLSLQRIVTNHWSTMELQQRLEVREVIYRFLRSPKGSLRELSSAAYTLLARITKLGWKDHDSFRTIIDDLVGMNAFRAMEAVVSEMNIVAPKKSLSQHRTVAVSFRDIALKPAFEAAVRFLRTFPQQYEDALALALSCLLFDFVGVFPDESADESATLQLPSGWRSLVEEENILGLFFDLYFRTRDKTVLMCLVQLAGVRRSLFSSEVERKMFLTTLLNGATMILRNGVGLENPDNRHEVCRLLAKMKSSNFPLTDLLAVDGYSDWINVVSQFTIATISDWSNYINSSYYLLSFFSRLASALPHTRTSGRPSELTELIPEIVRTYMLSRLHAIANTVSSNVDLPDFLVDEELLHSQIESVPYLIRSMYDTLGPFIVSLFDPVIQSFQTDQNVVAACQMCFLTYIAAGVLAHRGNSSSADHKDTIDGDITARVFQIVQISAGYLGISILEKSILRFFQEFRAAYVGEQSVTSSNIFERLAPLCGIQTNTQVMDIFVSRIVSNLRAWAANSEIVGETLALLNDLATGFVTRKIMVKLPSVATLLENHASMELTFLSNPRNMQARTSYYAALSKLLSLDDCSAQQFSDFMATFDASFVNISSREAFIGILRDLQGVCSSCGSRRSFERFFEWLHPQKFTVIYQGMQALALDHEASTACLRFLAELATNRNQRIIFGPSSPNGILLFKEIARILVWYCTQAVHVVPSKDLYVEKLKGIRLVLSTLLAALSGKYCNFGVFALYNDDSLSSALSSAVTLVLSVSLEDILAYPKVSRVLYSFLNALFADHSKAVCAWDASMFIQIVNCLHEGVKCPDSVVMVESSAALDHLCTYYVQECSKRSSTFESLSNFTSMPSLLPSILNSLFRITVFEESPSHYSISRPLLALITVNPASFADLKNQIIKELEPERRELMQVAFEKLMLNVDFSLEFRNRDQFSQNVTVFRQEIKKFM